MLSGRILKEHEGEEKAKEAMNKEVKNVISEILLREKNERFSDVANKIVSQNLFSLTPLSKKS